MLAAITAGSCGGPDVDRAPAGEERPADTVFDPLVETLDRAEAVQDTLDQRAAEQRRRLEEAEGQR
jgi:hypothetical protein